MAGFAGRLTSLRGAVGSFALGALANDFLQVAARLELLQNALLQFAGTGAKAAQEMANLRDLAKDTAGLSLDAAVKGVLRLRSMGFSAIEARNAISSVSNAVAAFGGNVDDTNANIVVYDFQGDLLE